MSLCVGIQRGVAAVLFNSRRVILLNLEEEEEEQEEEGESMEEAEEKEEEIGTDGLISGETDVSIDVMDAEASG